MKIEELRTRRAQDRLSKKEAEFRMLPANQGARYSPLWGLCKMAIDSGYNTYDTLKHYIDGVFLSQWGKLEPYIDGTVKHALQDTDGGKFRSPTPARDSNCHSLYCIIRFQRRPKTWLRR